MSLAHEHTSRLQSLARANQMTLSTIVQGAWALLLAHYNASTDVIFGAAFSGRPAELPEVEGMIGPCVTNVPVRVKVEPDESLSKWLSRLQQQQFDLVQHQHTPLDTIQGFTGNSLRHRLFDSLVVFQNYQVDETALRVGRHARLLPVAMPEETNYSLTLAVSPSEKLRFRLIYDPIRLPRESVQTYATDLRTLLETIAGRKALSVREVLEVLPAATRGRAAVFAAGISYRSDAAFSAPTNEVERAIAEIWQDLLGLESVSIDDNFFDLGGHSVLLLHVHARIQSKIGTHVPITALLQFPKVRTLARYLSGQENGINNASIAIQRANKQREAQRDLVRPR